MDDKKQFTISRDTQAVLAIYKDFNAVINRLYDHFVDVAKQGAEGNEDNREKETEELFKPYKDHVSAINAELMKRISTRIEWALSDGDETEI